MRLGGVGKRCRMVTVDVDTVVGTGETASRILLDTGEVDGEEMLSLSPREEELIDQEAVSSGTSSDISSRYSDAPSNKSSSE